MKFNQPSTIITSNSLLQKELKTPVILYSDISQNQHTMIFLPNSINNALQTKTFASRFIS